MKRRLPGPGLCVVVGAIATVAVAWRAVWLGGPGTEYKATPREAAELWRRCAPAEWGHETIVVAEVLMPPWGHETISVRVHTSPGFSRVSLVSELDTAPPADRESRYCVSIRAGWPFRALQGSAWAEPQATTRQALWEPPHGKLLGRLTNRSHSYPLDPLWPGFVADTLLYGAVTWLLFSAARRTRARARLDRRTCPRCTYDLRAPTGGPRIICPECGTELAAAWLARPRQVLRWWMAPAIVPAALLGAQLLGGRITWSLALRQFAWSDPLAACMTIAVFLAVAAGLYLLALRAYGDRSPGPRYLLSVMVAVVTASVALLPLYALVARLVA